jgi:AcrR family transcriptional regulator
MPAAKTARSQEARSAEMRRRLLDATLDSIHEVGFQNTSTTEVVRRAGVSRGALLHHFPTKEALIAAAVRHLLNTEVADIGKVAEAAARGEMTIEAFVDNMWRRFSGRLFMITLDYLASARTDPRLRESLRPITREFHQALDAIWTQFFEPASLSAKQTQVTLNMTLCLLRGMGVQTIQRDDPAYFAEMLASWKDILNRLLATRQPSGAG